MERVAVMVMVLVRFIVKVMGKVMVKFKVSVRVMEGRNPMKIPILYTGGLNSDSDSWSRSRSWSFLDSSSRLWSESWSRSRSFSR